MIKKISISDLAAKYFMRTFNAHDEDNLRVDQRLITELKRLGVVKTQYDFSRLCGKNPSYFSSMQAKGFGLKLGSLAFLASRIRKRGSEVRDPRVSMVLSYADRVVQQAIDEKCRLRELEIRYPVNSSERRDYTKEQNR